MTKNEPKKRVVVLIDSLYIEKWMCYALLKVVKSPHSQIVQLVVNSNNKFYTSSMSRLLNNLHKIFYYCFSLFDIFIQKRFFGANARDLVDVQKFVGANVPVTYAKPIIKKYTDEFDDTTLKVISKATPDVIVRFGFRILAGKILNIAPLGVWSYHHGDPNHFRGGPACFWEVVEKKPTTGLILQKINNELDGGEILQKRYISTAHFSPAQNYERALWSGINFLEQALRDYNSTAKGAISFFPFDRLIFKAPQNAQFAKIFVGLIFRIIYRCFQKLLYTDQWVIYISNSKDNRLQNYQKLSPPKDRFWADPFIMKRDGKHWVFFEEFFKNSKKAHIAAGELKGSELINIKPALVEKYHLSYPHLIEIKKKLYMVPESSLNKTIDLYICEEFPYKWRKVKTLMNNVNAVDSNVFFRENYWWLFTCISDFPGECPHSSFRIFWTKDIFDPNWVAHPMNPIVSDVRSARAGGKIIQKKGDLFRVVQDCSVRYGYSLGVKKIELLTTTQFEENRLETFGPYWDHRTWATHTYNECGDVKAIDALQSRWRF